MQFYFLVLFVVDEPFGDSGAAVAVLQQDETDLGYYLCTIREFLNFYLIDTLQIAKINPVIMVDQSHPKPIRNPLLAPSFPAMAITPGPVLPISLTHPIPPFPPFPNDNPLLLPLAPAISHLIISLTNANINNPILQHLLAVRTELTAVQGVEVFSQLGLEVEVFHLV